MKLGFPSYGTTFSCDCTLQEATERIEEAVACSANDFKLNSVSRSSGTQKIVLHAKWYGVVYHLFAPVSTLEIKEAEQGTEVSVTFSLREYMKIYLFVFCALAALLEGFFCTFYFMRAMPVIWPFFIPFAILLCAYAISCAALKISALRTLEILHHSLTLEFAKHLPSVHRC